MSCSLVEGEGVGVARIQMGIADGEMMKLDRVRTRAGEKHASSQRKQSTMMIEQIKRDEEPR